MLARSVCHRGSLRGRPRGQRLGEHLPLALRHPEMPISVCATTTMVDTFRSAHPAAGLVTRSIGDDDCYRHSRHRPASSGSVGQCTTRRRSAPDRRQVRQSPTTANYGPWRVVLDLIAREQGGNTTMPSVRFRTPPARSWECDPAPRLCSRCCVPNHGPPAPARDRPERR